MKQYEYKDRMMGIGISPCFFSLSLGHFICMNRTGLERVMAFPLVSTSPKSVVRSSYIIMYTECQMVATIA